MHQPHKPEAKDPPRIVLYDASEVEYWVRELGVSEKELKEIVARVGALPSKVREAARKDH